MIHKRFLLKNYFSSSCNYCYRELPLTIGSMEILGRPDICSDCFALIYQLSKADNDYEMIKLIKEKAIELKIPELVKLYDEVLKLD